MPAPGTSVTVVILVLNSGSSSLKYLLVDPATPAGDRRGTVERVGEAVPDHHAALEQALDRLDGAAADIDAVGHRVVHGGARFTRPAIVDDAVLAAIHEFSPLAPLHNPPAAAVIEAARRLLPDAVQVAVFDTAFHATLPAPAATYALDAGLARAHGIRRYGFHGISVAAVARHTGDLLGRPWRELNLVVLHLGNGASATAVRAGASVETSMGFTPLEGLVMGTRCGDLDPAVVVFLQRQAGLSVNEVDDVLVRRSGLAGLAGAADLREVLAARDAGDPDAALAIEVMCHRVRKYVGAYHAVLGRLDAVVFTAGIGEHAPSIRALSLAGLDHWGIEVDPARNTATDTRARVISPDHGRVAVCVVPTDEEHAIAEEVTALLGRRRRAT